MKSRVAVPVSLLFLFISLSLSGCASMDNALAGKPLKAYTGPKLSADQVAIIKGSGMRNYFREVFPVSIDNQKVDKMYIETLPGSHTLEVRVSQRLGAPGSLVGALTEKKATGIITLEAEGGHVYVLDGQVDSGQAVLWIEDEGTHQIVAGRKP